MFKVSIMPLELVRFANIVEFIEILFMEVLLIVSEEFVAILKRAMPSSLLS